MPASADRLGNSRIPLCYREPGGSLGPSVAGWRRALAGD